MDEYADLVKTLNPKIFTNDKPHLVRSVYPNRVSDTMSYVIDNNMINKHPDNGERQKLNARELLNHYEKEKRNNTIIENDYYDLINVNADARARNINRSEGEKVINKFNKKQREEQQKQAERNEFIDTHLKHDEYEKAIYSTENAQALLMDYINKRKKEKKFNLD